MTEFTLNNQEDSLYLHIHQLSNIGYILIVKQVHCINNMKYGFAPSHKQFLIYSKQTRC